VNRLSLAKRAQILSCLTEGNSIRATTRLVDVCKDTVLKLLCDVGRGCLKFHDEIARNLPCKRLEMDEIWAFCHTKDRHIRPELLGKAGIGTVYTWVAFDTDSKFIVEWLVGGRDVENAIRFVAQVFSRLSGRVQITSDGYKPYVEAVERAFGIDVDYAMLVKMYRGDSPSSELKRSSGCVGTQTQIVAGKPNPELISTSLVERQNLTMRMSMRRFTRKTNAFSKKIENHKFAVALHFIWYNFCRIHQSLRVTPAMEMGLSDHVWDMQELASRALSFSENRRAA
jgi:IS1 family transposase